MVGGSSNPHTPEKANVILIFITFPFYTSKRDTDYVIMEGGIYSELSKKSIVLKYSNVFSFINFNLRYSTLFILQEIVTQIIPF